MKFYKGKFLNYTSLLNYDNLLFLFVGRLDLIISNFKNVLMNLFMMCQQPRAFCNCILKCWLRVKQRVLIKMSLVHIGFCVISFELDIFLFKFHWLQPMFKISLWMFFNEVKNKLGKSTTDISTKTCFFGRKPAF